LVFAGHFLLWIANDHGKQKGGLITALQVSASVCSLEEAQALRKNI
jgi:hypothetical protein